MKHRPSLFFHARQPRRFMAALLGGIWLAMLAACTPEAPPVPVPPEATPLQVPADLSSERLDLVLDELRDHLVPRFGPLAERSYRLPLAYDWAAVQAYYQQALVPPLEPHAAVYNEGRRHRLAVWSAGGRDRRPMAAVAFMDTPVSGEAPTHRILIVLTPAGD